MSIPEIKKMTIQERLTTMEHIWDSLRHEAVEPETPDWHEAILSERKKLMVIRAVVTLEEAAKDLDAGRPSTISMKKESGSTSLTVSGPILNHSGF